MADAKMSGAPEQTRTEPEKERERVTKRHFGDDWNRVSDFLSEWLRIPTGQPGGEQPKLKNDFVVTSTLSTSLYSSVLLLSLGDCTYRNIENDLRPWLVNQHSVQVNEALARHITKTWLKMAVPKDQREQVGTIKKHMVYDLTDDKISPQMKALTCDDDGNVYVHINQLLIWSQPRRDESLDRKLEERFREFEEDRSCLKEHLKTISTIGQNDNTRLFDEKEKFKDKFSKFYDCYRQLEREKCIPPCYKFPTIQLALQTGKGERDGCGNTFTGISSAHDNEVPQKFAEDNNQMAQPLPTEEEVFNQLLGDTRLVYRDFFQDQ